MLAPKYWLAGRTSCFLSRSLTRFLALRYSISHAAPRQGRPGAGAGPAPGGDHQRAEPGAVQGAAPRVHLPCEALAAAGKSWRGWKQLVLGLTLLPPAAPPAAAAAACRSPTCAAYSLTSTTSLWTCATWTVSPRCWLVAACPPTCLPASAVNGWAPPLTAKTAAPSGLTDQPAHALAAPLLPCLQTWRFTCFCPRTQRASGWCSGWREVRHGAAPQECHCTLPQAPIAPTLQ